MHCDTMKGVFTLCLLFIAWQMTVRKKNKQDIKRLENETESLKFKVEELTKIIDHERRAQNQAS